MNDPGLDHARFGELAAGYALHALDQSMERRFLSHARQCSLCQQELADYADVAVALAETAAPAEPGPQLGPRILAAALADHPRDDHLSNYGHSGARDPGRGAVGPGAEPAPGARVIPLRPRRFKAAAAAAAAALVAGGTWAGLAASHGTSTPSQSVACGHPSACTEVPLTGSVTHQTAARVIIADSSAWLLPVGLPPDDRVSQIYVLWQVTSGQAPLPVGSFDVRPGADQPIRVGALAAPYYRSTVFAVSIEHGRVLPASPSHVVAASHLPV